MYYTYFSRRIKNCQSDFGIKVGKKNMKYVTKYKEKSYLSLIQVTAWKPRPSLPHSLSLLIFQNRFPSPSCTLHPSPFTFFQRQRGGYKGGPMSGRRPLRQSKGLRTYFESPYIRPCFIVQCIYFFKNVFTVVLMMLTYLIYLRLIDTWRHLSNLSNEMA